MARQMPSSGSVQRSTHQPEVGENGVRGCRRKPWGSQGQREGGDRFPAEPEVASWRVGFSHTSNAAAMLSGRTHGIQASRFGNLRRFVDAMGQRGCRWAFRGGSGDAVIRVTRWEGRGWSGIRRKYGRTGGSGLVDDPTDRGWLLQ